MTSVLFAEAQTTGSSLRGYVKDNQGGDPAGRHRDGDEPRR